MKKPTLLVICFFFSCSIFAQDDLWYVTPKGDTIQCKELDKSGRKIKGITAAGKKIKLNDDDFSSLQVYEKVRFDLKDKEYKIYDVVPKKGKPNKKNVNERIGIYANGHRLYRDVKVGVGSGSPGIKGGFNSNGTGMGECLDMEVLL